MDLTKSMKTSQEKTIDSIDNWFFMLLIIILLPVIFTIACIISAPCFLTKNLVKLYFKITLNKQNK